MNHMLNKSAIKQALKKKKLNQSDFADQLGVSHSAITHYLAGRVMPSDDKLQKISELLDLNLDDLLIYGSGYEDLMMELITMWRWLSMTIGHRNLGMLEMHIELIKAHFKLNNKETCKNAN